MHRILSYNTYVNMPGYDLVAVNPEHNTSARIQDKCRWRTGAEGFIIKNFNCDFVIVAKMNRGTKRGKAKTLPPDYFVSRPRYSSQSPGPRGGRQLGCIQSVGGASAEFTVTGLLHELGITSAFGGRNVCVGLSVPQTSLGQQVHELFQILDPTDFTR